MGGGSCRAVTRTEVIGRCSSLHLLDFSLLLSRGFRGWRVAIVNRLRPVSTTCSTRFGIKVYRPPTAFARALVLYFVESAVQ